MTRRLVRPPTRHLVNDDPHIRLTKSATAWRDNNDMRWEEFHVDQHSPCNLCGWKIRSGFTPDGGRRRFCGGHFRLYWADGSEMRQED